jgi:hypothetical protein
MDGNGRTTYRDEFDEAGYLRLYPDVAAAIARNEEVSGWNHYLHSGHSEGRRRNDFDEAFYLFAYPAASLDLARGRANSPLHHYLRIGQGRGYLPNARAPRANCAAAPTSPFGGLWIDLPNAFDLIEGKLDIGAITVNQARQLRFFREYGYVILPAAIPTPLLEAARTDLDRAYAGKVRNALFECGPLGCGSRPWQPEMTEHPAKVLDLHHFSSACLRIMFTPKISEFLGLIFESKAFASQSLGFLRGSAQECHQDSAYVVYTLPRHFAASWIALEDVTIGAGELVYYPGSHRLPDYLYPGHHKSVSEARRMGAAEDRLDQAVRTHVASLHSRAEHAGYTSEVFAATAGDVLIWHADLIHGGNPVSSSITRKSFVTHYCPRYAAPVFCEHTRTAISEHEAHYYTTSHYR